MEHGYGSTRQAPSAAPRDAWVVDGFAPLPGDSVRLPGGECGLVQTIYLCSEPDLGDAVTRWSWIVLADGRLLEVAPRGCALYEPPQLLERGSGRFLALVAQDGALVRFEERVRAGTWEARPVRLSLGGRRWQVTSTGTVSAQRLGAAPESGWGQLRTHQPGQIGAALAPPTDSAADPALDAMDCVPTRSASVPPSTLVRAHFIAPPESIAPSDAHAPVEAAQEPDDYFTFVAPNDPTTLGLGLWATDIVLAFGRRLGDSPAAAGLVG